MATVAWFFLHGRCCMAAVARPPLHGRRCMGSAMLQGVGDVINRVLDRLAIVKCHHHWRPTDSLHTMLHRGRTSCVCEVLQRCTSASTASVDWLSITPCCSSATASQWIVLAASATVRSSGAESKPTSACTTEYTHLAVAIPWAYTTHPSAAPTSLGAVC